MVLPQEVVDLAHVDSAHQEPGLSVLALCEQRVYKLSAGFLPLIHSRIAHESRTRVFMLTLVLLV